MSHDYAKIQVQENFQSLTKSLYFTCGEDQHVMTMTYETLHSMAPSYLFDLVMNNLKEFFLAHPEMPYILHNLIFGNPAPTLDDFKLKFDDFQSNSYPELTFDNFYTGELKPLFESQLDFNKFGEYSLGKKKNIPGSRRAPEVDKLPAVTADVKHPVTGQHHQLQSVIINLNDTHRWSREKIADWLETLDVDLRFK